MNVTVMPYRSPSRVIHTVSTDEMKYETIYGGIRFSSNWKRLGNKE